jgi:hypothetical protein
MNKTLQTALIILSLGFFSQSLLAFDVGGFVNGVIEGVSDSYKEAKGKPGAHEKDKKQQAKSTETTEAKESASAEPEEK